MKNLVTIGSSSRPQAENHVIPDSWAKIEEARAGAAAQQLLCVRPLSIDEKEIPTLRRKRAASESEVTPLIWDLHVWRSWVYLPT